MAEKFYTILTNIGKAQIANSGVMGSKVNFVKFKIGDGGGSYYEPTENQKDLIHTVYEGNITDIETDKTNPNWMKINLMIPANVGGFMIREYGVFDEKGNMLAVAKCAESYKPIAEDGSTKELILRMILAVSNTKSVNMELDPTLVFVTKEELEQLRTDIEAQLKDIANDSYPIVEATGTNSYIGSTSRITKLSKGTRCTLFVGANATGNCSLNLNNYGVKNIKDSFGNIVTNLKANIPYNLCYNNSDFILQGKGGGGNLISKYLLQGYYGDGNNGRVDGAMVNRGAPISNINCGSEVNLQEGYYSGGKVIANSLASQTQANATADKILSGFSAWINGNKIDGNALERKIEYGTSKSVDLRPGPTHSTHLFEVNVGFKPSIIIIYNWERDGDDTSIDGELCNIYDSKANINKHSDSIHLTKIELTSTGFKGYDNWNRDSGDVINYICIK